MALRVQSKSSVKVAAPAARSQVTRTTQSVAPRTITQKRANSFWAKFGGGGKSEILPNPTQEVGPEKNVKEQPQIYRSDKEAIYGPFGTRENPVKVPSSEGYRVVGCLGAHEEHQLLWHMVKEGKPHVCLECGQFFQLVKSEGAGAHGGHGHH